MVLGFQELYTPPKQNDFWEKKKEKNLPMNKFHGLKEYSRRKMLQQEKKILLFPNDLGQEILIIQKTFQRKSAGTSVVARVVVGGRFRKLEKKKFHF